MARITVPGFSGVVRILAPQRLEDHQAQTAIDCDFRSGDLRPYYGDRLNTAYGGPYSATDPSTLFLYDPGKLVVANGDYNFARSPVFFSDNSNDKRVFYSDQTPARLPDTLYPMVLESMSGSGVLPGGAKRLGVPKPGTLKKPAFDVQSGKITRSVISTANPTWFVIPKTDADLAALESGDKILIDAPGYVAGKDYKLSSAVPEGGTSATETRLYLSNDARAWKDVTLLRTKDSAVFKLKLASHGFNDDDLVFFSHKTTSTQELPLTNLNPSGTLTNTNLARVFKVAESTVNDFKLQYFDGSTWVTLERINESDTNEPFGTKKKVALLAPADTAFPNDMLPTVTPDTPSGKYEMTASVTYDQTKVTASWSNAETAETIRTRAYLVTFVNTFGDESEPSNPTETFEVAPKSKVTFPAGSLPVESANATTPVAQYAAIAQIRLYRTDELGAWRFVADIPWANRANEYVDTKPDTELAEPLLTTGWEVPKPGTVGLVNCPNGVIAGFRGRTIFGSVPYAPYAWPLANQVATDYDVVGLVPTSAGVVVVTKGMPAILIGDNPANWSMQKLEYPQGCVARRSIVDMGEFAMYASPDGLVAITGANVEILTKPIMTREQWQVYNPETLIAAQVEGRYIATYQPDSGSRKGFIYDPQTQSFTDLTLTAVAFCNDLLNDVLLMLGADGKIYEWNQDTTTFKPFHWVSKWFSLPIPELMGVAQIYTSRLDLTGRTLTFMLHGYDNNAMTKLYEISTTSNPDAIMGNRPFRLPYVAPGRFRSFQITLQGSIPVNMVNVGRTMDEMKEA